jgi:hypothetical protein
MARLAALFRLEQADPRLALLLQVTLGLAVFLLVEPIAFACGHLPASVYDRPVIGLGALGHAAPLIMLSGSVLAVTVFHGRLRWQAMELGTLVRWLALANCVALAWAYSTYPYNYWLDRSHDLDRFLLFVLPWLVLWHPGFLGVFLAQAYLMAGQFNEPLQYSWTDKLLLFEVLLLLFVFVWLTLATRRGLLPFVAAALCLVALYYVVPAGGKLALGWLSRNDQANIVLSAWHQNGWLDGLGAVGRSRVVAVVQWTAPLLKLATLVCEIGVVIMLAHRRVAVGLLAGCVAMHLGIMLTTGIFFWKWIVLDASLAAVVLWLPAVDTRRLFGPVQAAVGIGIVAVLFVVHRRPVILAWYDSPMAFQFRIEAVGAGGTSYEVTPAMLAPYDLPFAQGRFYFLTDIPMLVDCLGSTPRWDMLQALEGARTADDLAAIRRVSGSPRTDAASAERYEQLLQRFFRHEQTPRATSWMSRLPAPPQHIWTAPHRGDGQPAYHGQDAIETVRVRLREALFPDRQLHLVGDEVIRVIRLDPVAIGRHDGEFRTSVPLGQ